MNGGKSRRCDGESLKLCDGGSLGQCDGENLALQHDANECPQGDGLVQVAPSLQSSFMTPAVLSILLTETAERFVFYGFRALLVLYFHRHLEFSESTAIALYAYNNSLTYLTPLLGAALADGYFGRYRTIVSFGCIYVIGLFILTSAAVFSNSSLFIQRVGSCLGLVLIAVGTGGIKPCVSAFGADQVDGILVRRFFICFYFCINIGSLTGVAMIPMVRSWTSDGGAFLLASSVMGITLCIFVSQQRSYKIRSQSGANVAKTLQRMIQIQGQHWSCLQLCIPRLGRTRLSSESEDSPGSSNVDDNESSQLTYDARKALKVLPIMAMFPIYWSLYDQQGSVWTLQATRMRLPFNVQPEQLNIINPLQILLLIPLFERWIYPFLEQQRFNTSALNRMSWGMVITAAGFVASGLVESSIRHREENGLEPIHVAWQLPQITLVSIGEILLSITGLEFSYASSPERLKALVTALFLCTTAVGDALSGLLYSTIFTYLPRSVVMHLCAALLLVNHRVFVSVVVRQYEQQHQDEEEMDDEARQSPDFELPLSSRVPEVS